MALIYREKKYGEKITIGYVYPSEMCCSMQYKPDGSIESKSEERAETLVSV